MELDEYDYLEKTLENPLLEEELANGGDEIVKSEEKEEIKNSRHMSYKKREKEENESRSVHHSRSRDVERYHQSRFREDTSKKHVKEKDKEHERDERTVFVYQKQIALKATERDFFDFFSRAGKVRDIRLNLSRVSRRFTGIGYVEFHDKVSVPMAIAVSGQLLLGQSVMVKPSEEKKNLVQPTTAAARRLYVGNLHVSMSENDLQKVFEVFGSLERVQVSRDENGHSKGVAILQFARPEDASDAVNLDGELEIAGRAIKVSKYPL